MPSATAVTDDNCSCRSAAAACSVLRTLLLVAVLLVPRLPAASPQQAEGACYDTFAHALRLEQQSREGEATHCPPGCVQAAARNDPSGRAAPQLWGSFPYHNASSVCLAAIHAGVITNAAGGVVQSTRFYRQTWDGDDTQTVFPFQSHRGSLSNGVRSQTVPAAWLDAVPADRFAWSASVRAAVGPYIAQRRSAPFAPRAHHLHSSVFVKIVDRNPALYPVFVADVIIGGWNGSHYLNDVWVTTRIADDRAEEDWSWTRYADAPFTPRCDLLSWIDERDFHYTTNGTFVMYVIAGQTGHRCGLHELGSCSNEIWVAELRADPGVPMRMLLSWSHTDASTVAHLPFPPRCGASLIGYTPLRSGRDTYTRPPQETLVAIVGGQLSYADADCQSAPVVVNEAWYTIADPDSGRWNLGPAAPFSPRRSMAHDASFVHLSKQADLGNFATATLPSFTLVGGVRYTALRWDAALNRSVLTAAELMADVYECALPSRWYNVNTTAWQCAWNGHNSSETAPSWPADSTPLPVSDAASLRGNGGLGGVRIGGRTSRAAVAEWQSTPPVLVDDGLGVNTTEIAVNISVIISPYLGRAAQSLQNVMMARRNLSLLFRLDETELNDPLAPFALGSDWLVSHWQADLSWSPLLPQVSAVHYQPWAWSDTPVNASWYAPQAASALNTTRPHLNFRLRRHGHGMSLRSLWTLWGWQMISGGRSGGQYSNDWIRMSSARCAIPSDPQYRRALGPVEVLSMYSPIDGKVMGDAQEVSGTAQVRCAAGYHWDPPLRETQLSLYCAPNGMWTDLDALTLRRCVGSLNCSFPEVDLGFDQCEEPVPVITSISLTNVDALDVSTTKRVDNVTLVDIPIGLGTLAVRGDYFSLPLRVMVGGYECALPQLWTSAGTQQLLCEELDDGEACEQYAPELRCTLPPEFGINLPITVYSGYRSEMAEVANGALPTVSITPPRIAFASAADCTSKTPAGPGDIQPLLDCPNDRSFNVTVTFFTSSTVAGRPVTVHLMTDDPLNCTDRHVDHNNTAVQLEYVVCVVPPRVGSDLPLRLSQLQESREAVMLSFRPCSAGYESNFRALFNDSAGSPCLPCPMGYSTQGAVGQSRCEPCAPGSYANRSGQAACQACSPGSYMPLAIASQCWPCSANSWSRFSGRSDCDSCDMNRYIRYTLAAGNALGSTVDGTKHQLNVSGALCSDCPSMARCGNDGNISALTGGYLLLNQQLGLVSSIVCSSSACVSALEDDQLVPRSACMPAGPRLLQPSLLAVINCCASGRYPAYEPAAAMLASTHGSNVLCALCLPGYSEVNGRCIPCAGARWGAVCGLLLLSLLLVYGLHRLPHDFSGSASLTISAYFLQVSARVLSSEAMPQVLTLLNLSLDWDSRTAGSSSALTAEQAERQGDFYVGVCILPLTAAGKIRVRLLSPLVAMAMLGMVGALQAAASAAIRMRPSPEAWQLYHWLFVPSALPANAPSERQQATAAFQQQQQDSSDELDEKSEPLDTQPLLQRDSLRMYQRTMIRIALLSYSALSLLSMSFFRTQSVGEFGRRMVECPELDPQSAEYRLLMPAMVFLLVFVVVGQPVLLSGFLLYEQRRGEVQLVKDMALAGQERKMSARQALLLQLCAMYRTQQTWHAVVVLVRRLLLVLLLVLVPDSSVWIWLTALNFCFLALHLQCRPYERAMDNRLETLSLLSLSMQTTLLSVWPPPYMSQWLYSALCTLDVGPLLPLLISTVVAGWRRWRASKLSPAANNLNASLLSVDEQRDADL